MLRIKRKVVKRSATPNPKAISKFDKKIVKVETKDKKNTEQFTKFRSNKAETPNAIAAYVTMKSMEGRERLRKAYHVRTYDRWCRKDKINYK